MGELFEVVFEMPQWIRDGLDNKIFEVVGGVVRQMEGKQVVAWLRPATNAAGEAAEVGPNLALLPGGAALAAPAAAAAAAAVVVVVVAVGFAVVLKKLEILESKVDLALSQLRDLERNIAWLKRTEWTNQRGAVIAALRGCEDSEREGKFDDLRPHITTLRQSQHFLLEQLRAISGLDSPLKQNAIFTDVATMLVTVLQAKSWAMTLAIGENIARKELSQDAEEYMKVRAIFLSSLDQPEDNLERLLQLAPTDWDSARENLSALPGASATEYIQLEGFQVSKENFNELRSLSAPAPNLRYALFVSKSAAPAGWIAEMAC